MDDGQKVRMLFVRWKKALKRFFSVVGLDLYPGEAVVNDLALRWDSQLAKVTVENPKLR